MVLRPIAAATLMLAAFLAGGQRARAAEPHPADARTEKAKEHYLQGDAYYKLDKYANALQEYEQAYLAKTDPSFLYNIAQCHRLMGNRAEALKFYRRYLKDAPAAPNRAVAEKHIRDLEASLAAGDEAKPVVPPPAPSPTSPAMLPPAPPSPSSGVGPMPAPTAAVPPAQTLALNAPPPNPSDAPSGGNISASNPPSTDDRHPIYTRWWFWTGIGVVVVGGLLIAAGARHDPTCPSGRMCQ